MCLCSLSASAGTNLQLFYDFGSAGTACANQRTNRVTTTLELFYPDPWGNTFAFVDLDYNINPIDPKNTPFMAYAEIARCLNFWGKTKAKDLSIQVEYNGGMGLYNDSTGLRGYEHSPEGQAKFYADLIPKLKNCGFVIGAFLYMWNDSEHCYVCGQSDCPVETGWGIVDGEGNPKPAYYAVRDAFAQEPTIS